MKCISLWQPWATLLVTGHKVHETRSWPTNVRGTVAIHAAKKKDAEARDLVLQHPFCDALNGLELDDLPFGCILGTVDIVACVRTEGDVWIGPWNEQAEWDYYFGNFSPDRWAWRCANPVRWPKPIPYRGMQGFFDVPDDLFWSVDQVLDAAHWFDSPGGAL